MVQCTQKAVSWEGKEVFLWCLLFFLGCNLGCDVSPTSFPIHHQIASILDSELTGLDQCCPHPRLFFVCVCVFEAILDYIWNPIFFKKDINKTKTKQQRSRTKLITITETAQYIRIYYKAIPNVFIIDLPSAILFTIEKTTLS